MTQAALYLILYTFTSMLISFTASAENNTEGLAVVVHPTNKITLERHQIELIFTGAAKVSPKGNKITPYNQHYTQPITTLFNRLVLGKSPQRVRTFWAKQLFTGRGRPPHELSDDTAVIEKVSSSPDAISYVSASSVNSTVRVVAILTK